MKEGLHPELHPITITCACGHQIQTISTIGKNFTIEICSHCHPYFTGKQKLIDSAGRVERFQKKYAKFQKKTKH
ncbi:MAG: 50S ribosomal protein L31 [Deltaproteobacteria bacterium RIFCSPLOWO2_01_44_7]|nr:MAG: 50S ribosomal protein L31 [Deltaproteobacteria bacterium RIFCSPHIGHO2_01_FULL_43_49]OGQ14473.1 MAG: 50S ribosomal protein L31 [Deltaproteobacteria bacterium RIFCSPHIGHO2_02_FULL_44_53]OGQ27854.1 MAG: 50S ribosomal protein L31 [Deltaproteobacteria bacterium RIFCSPHIGHO2_12_FULL_44_21]OGQ30930.1 MAG: 50S ribosomal protein L31 [Deltaproteobacteria bacterium RIFCSPLOWO2_01_FULL_45_74]OGQ38969.1 MAG: 50S ribosomal protein L31 [Deltaproteobacteria bacterium RIFCSPLOWO2_01_44_7]OGQ42590.1 MAG